MGGFARYGVCCAAAVAACCLQGGCHYSFEFDSGSLPGPVVIVSHPQSTTVTAGGAARFEVSTSGGSGEIRFQWQRNGQPIDGADRAAYVTSPTTPADDGTLITATVCDASLCVTSLPALLTVLRPQ